MNLAFMDASFGIIKYIKYINLQWTRRYYEPGEFSVQLPASEYVSDAVYLYTKDRPEVGIIQKREYADGYDGEVMQLSGFFYEYKLNDKITFPRFDRSGNIEDLARAIVIQGGHPSAAARPDQQPEAGDNDHKAEHRPGPRDRTL